MQPSPGSEVDRLRTELKEVEEELKTASSNLARAKSDAQFDAVSVYFDQLTAREATLQAKLAETKAQQTAGKSKFDVTAVISGLEKLLNLASSEPKLKLASEAIQVANAKLFLKFQQTPVGKRTLNRISGGIATFGDGEPPIEVFKGPTARDQVKLASRAETTKLTKRDHPIDEFDLPIVIRRKFR